MGVKLVLESHFCSKVESCLYDQCVRLFIQREDCFCLSDCVYNLKSTVRRSEHVWKISVYFSVTSWSSKETSWLDQSKIKSHCFRMYKVPTLHFLWKRKLKFKWISPHCVFCMYFNIRIHPGQISKKCIKCMNEQRVCVTY